MEDLWPAHLEDCRVIRPAGELDVATALDFSALLRGIAPDAGADWLIVDLGRVTFMGCSPLNELCRSWNQTRSTGRWTRLVYDHPSIGLVLRLMSLQQQFPRYASIDTAWREHGGCF
ncbi:STAS domain-containing protein [Streptomyces chrestomyceticus]|uniref:STAS domain-containing protein n=1 Tax=Streptomyces chrestomyceticus TaxID=68185 RepID=UPI0033D301D6